MDIQGKRDFLHELLHNIGTDIMKVIPKMLEDWDGIELRWYISEKFAMEVGARFKDKRSRRYQDYRNFVITRGL